MQHGLCRGWGLRTRKDDQVAIEQPITAEMADIFDQVAGHLVDGEFLHENNVFRYCLSTLLPISFSFTIILPDK